MLSITPGSIYFFKVNNGNTRTMCKICSKLITETRCHSRRSCVFIVNFKQISHVVLVFPMSISKNQMPTRPLVQYQVLQKQAEQRLTSIHQIKPFVSLKTFIQIEVNQQFQNNPVNREFCRPEKLKFLYLAMLKNLFTGVNFTKCNTFYSGVTIRGVNIAYFHFTCHF